MPHPLLNFSKSDYLIQIVDINSYTEWQTVQIQISWLLQKPTDLDLHCLQRQGISRFSGARVKVPSKICIRQQFFYLFFRENKSWHFMWIISQADDSHEMSILVFSEKKKKVSSAAVVIGALRINSAFYVVTLLNGTTIAQIRFKVCFCLFLFFFI